MKKNPIYPLKHLSVRVPWHDNYWNGIVCKEPHKNSACLILKNCGKNRNDEKEKLNAGKSINDLEEDNYPTCVAERGVFMAPFSFYRKINHPYAKISPETHGHLRETTLYHPPYSALTVTYSWMLKQGVNERVDKYDLDYDPDREPKLSWAENWVQESRNQNALFNCFYGHLDEGKSLAFFYAKQVPFIESSGRVLIGVGRINKIIPSEKYEGSNKRFASVYWEHTVAHSIRPDFSDGFIFPYQEALEYQKKYADFDITDITVVVPSDKMYEFSYASEHVSNDTAIRLFLDIIQKVELQKKLGIGKQHDKIIQWVHDRLHEIEKLRGYYPGMGATLCAFGIEKGHFVAAEIINNLKDKEDPWLLFEKAIKNPNEILSDHTQRLISRSNISVYKAIKNRGDSSRIDLLHLISRFDISIEQAKAIYVKEERSKNGIDITDEEIIKNPYLLYELTSHKQDKIIISTIDLGIFKANEDIKILPYSFEFDDPLDPRRIRALTIQQLELAAGRGHTLLSRKELVNQIRNLSIKPKCELNSDYYDVAEPYFDGGIVQTEMADEAIAYQLERLYKTRKIIKNTVLKRTSAQPIEIVADWRKILDDVLDKHPENTPLSNENKVREEKSAALKVLSETRFSVLIGPAGTGKTRLLEALASHQEIKSGGLLFLAPTGKARVRLEEVTRRIGLKAKTIAQFLCDYKRYDGDNQRYILSNQRCEGEYENVIIDESSMLTEEMLATIFDCFKGVKRYILVGDHRQLPPIGPGRPFVDIISYLRPEAIETKFPRVGKGFAELTQRCRHGGANRDDLLLAEWFSGETLEPAADSIFNKLNSDTQSEYIKVVPWKDEDKFEAQFEKILVDELKLGSIDNFKKFNESLGAKCGLYFNFKEAVEKIERWQILSPVREKIFGIRTLNRKMHILFKSQTKDYILKSNNYPKPVGSEQILYGDKVINLYNKNRKNKLVYPDGGLNYVANGEIGVVIGQVKRVYNKYKGRPKFIEIEFSSQKGYKYTFKNYELDTEDNNPLELAYAITVHKSQGSEFETVFLVIPNPCSPLSRELLYTALTRQKKRVVLLFQGDITELRKYSSPEKSDTLSRITNLFRNPNMVDVKGKYLEKYLIHQASDGILLRSKSELLIYQQLLSRDLNPIYEKTLIFKDVEKIPDFTIVDDDTGQVYYWEHCGVFNEKEYDERWENKKKWYTENGIIPFEQGGGPNGSLIVTYDKPVKIDGDLRGAFSIQEIDELIQKVFNV